MKKATNTKRQMSIRAYRAAFAKLLDGTPRPIAAAVYFMFWDDYIANGIYLNPEFVKADIACAEGHLTNPPVELPEEGIEINPGSTSYVIYRCTVREREFLKQTEMRLGNHMTVSEMLQHKKNALSLIQLFSRYNTDFGNRGILA